MDHRFKFLVWVFLVSQININNRSENLGFFFCSFISKLQSVQNRPIKVSKHQLVIKKVKSVMSCLSLR